MIELTAKIGATVALAAICWWGYNGIKDTAHTFAANPLIRQRIRNAKMLRPHWLGAALAAVVLTGVWL